MEPGVSVAAGVGDALGSSVEVEAGKSVGEKVDLRVGTGLALSGVSVATEVEEGVSAA